MVFCDTFTFLLQQPITSLTSTSYTSTFYSLSITYGFNYYKIDIFDDYSTAQISSSTLSLPSLLSIPRVYKKKKCYLYALTHVKHKTPKKSRSSRGRSTSVFFAVLQWMDAPVYCNIFLFTIPNSTRFCMLKYQYIIIVHEVVLIYSLIIS